MPARPGSGPKCPVDFDEREWLESRLGWLAEQFGWHRLHKARVVLPTPEFFPDSFAHTEACARRMFERICGYFDVAPHSVELGFYDESNPLHVEGKRHGTAGFYERAAGVDRIWIEISNLEDPLGLAATMAHELGHVLLLGEGRISTDTEDQEPLTDLLTVYLGLGVLTANSVIRERYWHAGLHAGWKIGRHGYLTMPMHGYALALFALARGEDEPGWAKALRPDVRVPFQQAVRYLEAQGEIDFSPRLAQLRLAAPLAEPAEFDESEPDDMPRCTYCGVPIDPAQIAEHLSPSAPGQPAQELWGVCDECRDSLEENHAELENERDTRRRDKHRGCFIVCIAAGALLLAILALSVFSTLSGN